MDKNEFLKGMEELLQIARTNDNHMSQEEILSFFQDYNLNDEAKKLLLDSFVEAGVRVDGHEAKKEESSQDAKEEDQRVVKFYEEELVSLSLPDDEGQKELLGKMIQGEDVFEEVIECMLPAVVDIAKGHQGKGVLLADMIQEGNIGLMEAVSTFEGKDEDEFFVYVRKKIEEVILDAIADQTGSDTVGKQMAMKANRLDEAATHLAKELDREATAAELAEYLDMTEEEVKSIMKVSLDAISIIESNMTPDA